METTGISLNSIVRASSGSGRISLAVPASAAQYSGLKHITLMPLPFSNNSEGFSITRLRALDTLIDILSGEGKLPLSGKPAISHLPPEKVDALVSRYSDQLKTLLAPRKLYAPAISLKGLLVNGLV